MFISARDLARMGLLGLNNGRWGDKQILSEQWVRMARTPTGPNPGYGYMNWFLNTDRKLFPAAREDAVDFIGNGDNIVFIDYRARPCRRGALDRRRAEGGVRAAAGSGGCAIASTCGSNPNRGYEMPWNARRGEEIKGGSGPERRALISPEPPLRNVLSGGGA